MGVTVKNIIPAKLAENAQTAQYTANGCKTIIDTFTVVNVGIANASISINLVPKSGTAAASNLITVTRSVAPGQSWRASEVVGHALEDGGFISTLASSATDLSIRATGREIV